MSLYARSLTPAMGARMNGNGKWRFPIERVRGSDTLTSIAYPPFGADKRQGHLTKFEILISTEGKLEIPGTRLRVI